MNEPCPSRRDFIGIASGLALAHVLPRRAGAQRRDLDVLVSGVIPYVTLLEGREQGSVTG